MTTLQHIIQKLRDGINIESGKINYGMTDGLEPPYANVLEFVYELDRDTGGPALRNCSYRVECIGKGIDEAIDLGEKVIAIIDQGGEAPTITPDAIESFLVTYGVGQLADRLYQFGVTLSFTLQENIEAVNT